MALPLFKLPLLVVKLILETMGFIEIFLLTSTTTKTKQIFKNLVKVRNYELHLFMKKGGLTFDFRSISDPNFGAPIFVKPEVSQRKNEFGLKIGTIDKLSSKIFKLDNGTFFLAIYCNNTINRGTEVYNVLMEVFRLPIQSITMSLEDVSSENYRSWINWNNDLFYDIPFLDVGGKCSFHDYVWILKNVKTQNKLFLDVEPLDYPEDLENIEVLNVEVAFIIISHGKWVRLEQLKAFKAQIVDVNSASLTDSQINAFLRDWRDSEVASTLRELTICFNREADVNIVLQELDVTDENLLKSDDALNQWSFKSAKGEKLTVIYAKYTANVRTFGFEFRIGN